MRAIGEFCVRRRLAVLISWIVLVGVGLGVSSFLFSRLDPDFAGAPNAESTKGVDALGEQGSTVIGLIDGIDADSPTTATALGVLAKDLLAIPDVAKVAAPLAGPDGAVPEQAKALISTDGEAVLVNVTLDAGIDRTDRDTAVDAVSERLHQMREQIDGASVQIGGGVVLFNTLNDKLNSDLVRGELISLPIVAIVLVVVFAGLLPALLPLFGALGAIAGGLAILLVFSTFLDLSSQVVPVVTMLALGLSIDYSLLTVSRFREERAKGASVEEAIALSVARAGRTVVFSAITVAVSLAGLFVFDQPIFPSIAAAGVAVVLVALLTSITLVPTLLAFFGERIKVPENAAADEGFFSRLASRVQRRPWLVFLGLVALLGVIATPALGMKLEAGASGLLPPDTEPSIVATAVSERFTGQEVEPVIVVSRATPDTLQQWADAKSPDLINDGLLRSVRPATQISADWSMIQLLPSGTSEGEQAQDLVDELRSDRPPGGESLITGSAAFLVDFTESIASSALWALLFVVVATFVLLFLLTGSVLIPVKALVMNLLSLGASFGLVVLIFQEGYLSGILGFTSTGAIQTTIPVLVLAFAFGLSMDYEVFLLARITEEHADPANGKDTDVAVRLGLQHSGRIITSAALLVVVVFAGFATAETLVLKEMGVALAIAVALDATIVRMLLVPATMTLLGSANWWAPAPLRRLHNRFGVQH